MNRLVPTPESYTVQYLNTVLYNNTEEKIMVRFIFPPSLYTSAKTFKRIVHFKVYILSVVQIIFHSSPLDAAFTLVKPGQ